MDELYGRGVSMNPKEALGKIQVAMEVWTPRDPTRQQALEVLLDLVNQPRTVAEIRAEVEKWYNKFVEADNFFKQKGLSTFMSGFSAGRDTCKDILDFIDGEEK